MEAVSAVLALSFHRLKLSVESFFNRMLRSAQERPHGNTASVAELQTSWLRAPLSSSISTIIIEVVRQI